MQYYVVAVDVGTLVNHLHDHSYFNIAVIHIDLTTSAERILLRETDFYVNHWLPEDDFRLQVRYDTVLIDRSPTLAYDELPYGQDEEDPDLI